MSIELTNPYVARANEYKGQLHFHSTNSDGIDTPAAIVTAYRAAGYDFVCLTDHNVLTADPGVGGILFIPGVEEGGIGAGSGRHMGNINATVSHYSEDLFVNGGFETPGALPPTWLNWPEVIGDGAIANEVVIVHSGVDAAKLMAGVTANTSISQHAAVTPGETYTIRIWTRGDGTNGGRLAVWDSTNGAWILVTTEIGIVAAAWEVFEYDVTAPAGCVLMLPIFRCPVSNGGICYYDDAEFLEYGVPEGQDMVDVILADGAIPIVNHPDFSNKNWTDAQLLSTVGYTAIEIYNALITENSEARWDFLLSGDVSVYGIAADDSHDLSDFRFATTSTRVFADTLSVASIVAALKAGNYYSSTGPDITISVSENVITITTAAASTIEFIGNGGAVLQTESVATISSYAVERCDVYARARVTRDADSERAWSNPFWVVEESTSKTSSPWMPRCRGLTGG